MKQRYEKPYLDFFVTNLDDVICSSADGLATDPWKDEW